MKTSTQKPTVYIEAKFILLSFLLLTAHITAVASTDLLTSPTACRSYLESLSQTTQTLQRTKQERRTREALSMLDPTKGTGFLTLDVTNALPEFLQGEKHKQVDWPAKGTFVFDGDRTVPHYVEIDTAQKELQGIVGESRLAQLKGFGDAMLRFVFDELPAVEKDKMHKNKVGLVLDLAELRICETTGCPLHIDWYPREGMVMVIPIYGDRTIVHHKDKQAKFAAENPSKDPSETHASLISAYGRWANFHAFEVDGTPNKGWRDNGQGVVVPNGVKEYLGSRANDVPDDLLPEAPGVLPTVHQAATGSRMVMVLNFSYRPLSSIPTPYAAAGPKDVSPAAKSSEGRRSSAEATGDPDADHDTYLLNLFGYDGVPSPPEGGSNE